MVKGYWLHLLLNLHLEKIDVKKETDPRMHSAEHILNQTMDRMFHCGRCFSAHIEKKKSKCDYRFNRPLTDEEVEELQRRVNGVIQSELSVVEEYITRDEATSLYDLKRVPETAGDKIRIIKVGDYDAVPCIGNHVTATNEIGHFGISSTTYENDMLRIRFKLKK
jgi:Ser-tRNA(Ala) deacylase AlaX